MKTKEERVNIMLNPAQKWVAGVAATLVSASLIGLGAMLFQVKETLSTMSTSFAVMQEQMSTLSLNVDRLTNSAYRKEDFLRDSQILELRFAAVKTELVGLDKRVTSLEDTCKAIHP